MTTARPLVILPFVVLCVGLLAGSLIVFLRGRAYDAETTRIEGTVVEVGHEVHHDTREYYTTGIYEWTGPDGVAHRDRTSRDGSSSLAVGEKIALRYHPSDPARAHVDELGSYWAFTGALAFFGVVFSGMLIRVLLKQRRA